MKSRTDTIKEELFKPISTVSVEEVLAAGGATAYGIKTGKNSTAFKKALRDIPKPDPFTKEEWDIIERQLENDR